MAADDPLDALHLTSAEATQTEPVAAAVMDADPAREGKEDNWWAFALGVIGILLPILLLFPIFVRDGHIEWPVITTEIADGTFLAPIAILCVDTIRRLFKLRRSSSAVIRIFQTIAAAESAFTALVCFIGAGYIQSTKISPQVGHSVSLITFSCLLTALALSITGVILANRLG